MAAMHYCPGCGFTENMKRIGKTKIESGVQTEDWGCKCGARMRLTATPATGQVQEVYTYVVKR